MKISVFRTLRAKILVIILPMIILAMMLLSWFTYINSEGLINREIDTKMQYLLDSTIHEMQTKLTAHLKLPVTLARTIESAGDVISKDTQGKDALYKMIQQYLTTNDETFGIGVWYEPYQYKKYLKFFGTYAYRFNGQILYTEDYNTEAYNYPNQEWYKLGMNTTDTVLWTDPYYDENSKSTILTTTSPFYHYNGEFRGVVTANINFDNLQKIVDQIKVGETGWAFLVDKKGVYIVDNNVEKILKQNVADDPNQSLAMVGKKMMADQAGNAIYEENGHKYRVFFKEVPETSWRLALVIPEAELLSPLNNLMSKSIIIIVIALLFIVGILYYFSRYITIQIRKVNELAMSMAEGDFTKTIDIQSSDELGTMGTLLNRMVLSLNEVLRKVYDSSDQLAETSVQLSINTEQTTKAAEEIATSIQLVSSDNELQLNRTNDSNEKVVNTYNQLERMSGRISSVSNSTQMTLQTAKAGNDQIQETVQHIHFMHSKTDEAVLIIKQLNVKSKEINQIIDMVNQIALRTKILALNAGITASQAGSQGKAFSIIAQEIKTLAENSSKAGQQIQELIGEIQQEIAVAVHAMDNSKDAVVKGRDKAEHANRSFENILLAVNVISNDTSSISDSITEIHRDMMEMVTSIQQITEISVMTADRTGTVSAATEEQMASMEEITSSSNVLSHLAIDLKKSVEMFKLY